MTIEPPPVSLTRLSDAERRILLRLARESIAAVVRGTRAPACVEMTSMLLEPAAAFVSLHSHGRLRGCIGTVTPERPLHETVSRMAIAAAFEDPRFAPLLESEMPSVEIEISRLSAMQPARPEHVRPGIHGVSLSWGENRAVFLPQVAYEHQWDLETLMSELCRKALLPPGAWRLPEMQLMVFVAEVFGEAQDVHGREM